MQSSSTPRHRYFGGRLRLIVSSAIVCGAAGLLISSQISATAVPAGGTDYRAHLAGRNEVPARDTNAQGQVLFSLSDDGLSLSYKLIATNIDNVFGAHIHIGEAGVNGPVVVALYDNPGNLDSHNGILAEGTITAADLTGPLAGQPLSALLELMDAGDTYVNVHTNDGVAPPNTGPGDFPGGEIRGQVGKVGN